MLTCSDAYARMTFLGEKYLLETEAAVDLYGSIADEPILDPHSHADVEEIVTDEGWRDIWEVEGATDHYVWELMRKRGVDEEKITGDAPNVEKWRALAEVMPEIAGNPTYEWIHLDLQRRFGIEEPVSADTADEIWVRTREQLREDSMRPQRLLREMNVDVLCSTDDPTSSLEYHERAVTEVSGTEILPTWRADRAVNIGEPTWGEFLVDLEDATGIVTDEFDGFLAALSSTHDHFADHGCRASDLGIYQPESGPVTTDRAREIFRKARMGDDLEPREINEYTAFMLEFIGELNAEKEWVMQLHIGAYRNYRNSLYERLGTDVGGDISSQEIDIAGGLRHFLNAFDGRLEIVLYCVDPTHYPTVVTIARAFPNVSVGAPWWFNDSPHGLEWQLEYAGTVDLLANYGGMVSDSRKFISFGSRFEMFRRSLANVYGRQVERGQLPPDVARDQIKHVVYDRPKALFGF